MTIYDYIVIALTLVLYRYLTAIVLCTSKNLSTLHHEMDLYGLVPEQLLQKLDRQFKSRWIPPLFVSLVTLAFFPFMQWQSIDPIGILRYFIVFSACIAAWKATTQDIDLRTGKTLFLERLALLGSVIGVFLYPGFLALFLFVVIHMLKGWYHHQMMLLRILQIFFVFCVSEALMETALIAMPWHSEQIPLGAPVFLILCMMASHYAVAGFGKIKLGKHWYSWMWDNHMHYLAASAYLWGWLRSSSEHTRIRFINIIKTLERPIQVAGLIFECGWMLVLFDYHLALALTLLAVLFHLNVFAVSGIFFWQSTLVNLACFVFLYHLPPALTASIFNPVNGVLAALVLVIFPLQQRIWAPQKLAWWDAPFVGRVHWQVEGISGKVYGLYNDFMCPHERFFGRIYANVLVPHKIFHRHLGEVNSYELSQKIVDSKGNLEKIKRLQQKYGTSEKDPMYEEVHDNYMIQFFRNFNLGNQKYVCPKWLKAPGGQFYYWGLDPPFYGQEKVKKIIVTYREEFFDGSKFIHVRSEHLKDLELQ